MAGNSARKGSIRKTKKGATVGTGGHGRKKLAGKGPTPKAEDRVYHVAYKKKQAAAKATPAPRPAGKPVLGEIVVGRNSVLEALRAQIKADALYVFNHIDVDERVTEMVELALTLNLPVHEVTKTKLDEYAAGLPHQGVLLTVPPYEYVEIADLLALPGTARIVVLDGIQDPRNLGAIMRSAAAFGATGIVIPKNRAAGVTAAAWKVSAGAAAHLPVARVTNLARSLADLKKAGVFVVGLAGEADLPIRESALLSEPLALVVGSEGSGLSRLIRETCDQVVSIPIANRTESLNAGVAAAIALYEVSQAAHK